MRMNLKHPFHEGNFFMDIEIAEVDLLLGSRLLLSFPERKLSRGSLTVLLLFLLDGTSCPAVPKGGS